MEGAGDVKSQLFRMFETILPRDDSDDMLARYMLSSCVRPSVTSRHSTKTAKRRITQKRYRGLQ